MAADTVVLGIIIGTLAAIVYSLRVLILLERRISRMDLNIESLTRKVLSEELKLEKDELMIEGSLGLKKSSVRSKKVVSKKRVAKKTVKKSAKKSTKKVAKKAVKKTAKKSSRRR